MSARMSSNSERRLLSWKDLEAGMKVLTSRRVTWLVYRSGLSGAAWWSIVWAPAVLFVSGVELWHKALITAGIVGYCPCSR